MFSIKNLGILFTIIGASLIIFRVLYFEPHESPYWLLASGVVLFIAGSIITPTYEKKKKA